MSKVILTEDQAKIIEETKFALAGFSNEILVRCLNGEYEIKPRFKVGEYIVYENEIVKNVMQIINIDSDDIIVEPIYTGFEDYNRVSVNSPLIRHATPEEIAEEKERRWWKKHGRDVREVRSGDIIYSYSTGITFVRNDNARHVTSFDGFQVVCFVENRLDVKDDE